MQEKKQKILLICLEAISLAILLPVFYWGAVRFMLRPIGKIFYPPDLYYGYRVISAWMVFVFILVFNAIWVTLMKLCPQDKTHIKVVLTLLVLTFSASVLSCFIVLDALEGTFLYDLQIDQIIRHH